MFKKCEVLEANCKQENKARRFLACRSTQKCVVLIRNISSSESMVKQRKEKINYLLKKTNCKGFEFLIIAFKISWPFSWAWCFHKPQPQAVGLLKKMLCLHAHMHFLASEDPVNVLEAPDITLLGKTEFWK